LHLILCVKEAFLSQCCEVAIAHVAT